MGLLKKIFKPVSKVLDKIIPNEIKPALPYLAAFAPYFGPTSSLLGKGIMQRALLSGGLNIGAQLAQEGNEGDINLLSAGLGALSGAMTAPSAADTFAGSRIVGTGADGKAITASEYAKLSEGANLGTGTQIAGSIDPGVITAPIQGPVPFSQVVPGGEAGLTGLAKTKNLALTGLEKGSKFISEGMAGGLKDKAKVLSIPAATATGDLMQAEARQLEKQAAIDAALAEAEALADAGMRGDAIRNAMRAYGFFTDDEIEETVSSAGYRAGGRVGFDNGGGLFSFLFPDKGRDTFSINEAVAENMQIGKLPYETTSMILELNRDGKSVEEISEITGVDVSDVGEMLNIANMESPMEVVGGAFPGDALNKMLAENVEIRERPSNLSYKAKGGRVGFRFGGIDAAIDKIETEKITELVESDKGGLDSIKDKMAGMGKVMKLFETPYGFDRDRFESMILEFKDYKEGGGDLGIYDFTIQFLDMVKKDTPKSDRTMAKEGGLMDLGGKEMDLRGGGFVPIGKKEKADDVPARLSKNEFVMTADAVRAAGGGSVNKGAKRMYNLMNNLEARA